VRHAGSLIQSAKASFILLPASAPLGKRKAGGYPRTSQMPQYATLNPGISALAASHALALPLEK